MADDPQYSKPAVWLADELITSTKLNQMVDNSENHEKYKLAVSGDSRPANSRIARGSKQLTITASPGGPYIQQITFATDASDGDPVFTSAPMVWCQLSVESGDTAAGGYNYSHGLQNVLSSGFQFVWDYSDQNVNAGSDITITLFWLAIGEI